MNTLVMMGDMLSNDNNLKKAIYYGVNRENVILLSNEGIGEPAKNLYSKSLMRELDGCVDVENYNEDLAKDYLSKSNYNENTTIKISVSDTITAAMAQSVQEDLRKIGIKTEIEQLDANAWFTKVMNGETEIIITPNGGATLSPETLMMYWSKNDPYFGKYMETTDEFEDLILKITQESDKNSRNDMLKRTFEIQKDLANLVPIYEVTFSFAYNNNLSNIHATNCAAGMFYIEDYKVK